MGVGVLTQYEDRLRRLRRHKSTITAVQRTAVYFEDWLEREGLTDNTVTAPQMERYFAELELAPSTKQLHFTHMRAAYRYAGKLGQVEHNPTEDVMLERVPAARPRMISVPELRKIRDRASYREIDWRIFHMLAYTGMRRHEILGARYEDIDRPNRLITVLGKGDKYRQVPLHPALAEALERGNGEYIIGLSPWGIGKIVQRITDGAWRPHDFRKTVASSLHANDVQTDIIDAILGWSNGSIRMRYYVELPPERLFKAICKLYGGKL